MPDIDNVSFTDQPPPPIPILGLAELIVSALLLLAAGVLVAPDDGPRCGAHVAPMWRPRKIDLPTG